MVILNATIYCEQAPRKIHDGRSPNQNESCVIYVVFDSHIMFVACVCECVYMDVDTLADFLLDLSDFIYLADLIFI